MKIRPIAEGDYPSFRLLFTDYFNELDCEDDPEYTFDEFLLPDLQAGRFDVAVAEEDGETVGFVIYQIDELLNPWHFKEGSGDVRELFVSFKYRERGIGASLLKYAEEQLKKDGAEGVYVLPVEESEEFFTRRGYSDTGEVCKGIVTKVFEKKL